MDYMTFKCEIEFYFLMHKTVFPRFDKESIGSSYKGAIFPYLISHPNYRCMSHCTCLFHSIDVYDYFPSIYREFGVYLCLGELGLQ